MAIINIEGIPDDFQSNVEVVSYYITQLNQQWLMYIDADNRIVLTGGSIDWEKKIVSVTDDIVTAHRPNGDVENWPLDVVVLGMMPDIFDSPFTHNELFWLMATFGTSVAIVHARRISRN